MKKSLAKLPKHKRDELKIVKEIILEKLDDVQMIILFGSYGRGEAVEETYTKGHITYEYISDFDILVITSEKAAANDNANQSRIDNLIYNRKQIKTPAGIIYHDIDCVNARLSEGQYFFSDIKKEGIILYDTGKCKLEKRQKLDPQKRKSIAEEDFKHWLEKAKDAYRQFEHALNDSSYQEAAFNLHQATERLYTAVLLVFRGYKAKIHNIRTLGRRASSCDGAFLRVFPRVTEKEKRMFKLLLKAYIDARYKADYEITESQLKYLAKRVKLLQKLTKEICKKKIESFV